MENFKITNLELIALCVQSEIQVEPSTCHPEKCSTEVWNEINHVLNSNLSVAAIKRNIASIEDICNWNSISDVMEKQEIIQYLKGICTEEQVVDLIKTMLVQETLNKSYFEQLYKKLVNKETGKCYVPETLSLGVFVKWLATPDNLKKLQEAKAAKNKIDERPLFTVEMMMEYLSKNREIVQEKLKEIDQLKASEKKEDWQVKTNALIQQVSNNDFRVLKWSEIYRLIRENVKY